MVIRKAGKLSQSGTMNQATPQHPNRKEAFCRASGGMRQSVMPPSAERRQKRFPLFFWTIAVGLVAFGLPRPAPAQPNAQSPGQHETKPTVEGKDPSLLPSPLFRDPDCLKDKDRPTPGEPAIPRPGSESAREIANFIERTVDAEFLFDLNVGIPRIVVFKEAPRRVQMDGDEKSPIATFTVISQKEISFVGKKPGRTVLNLWFTDPKDPTKQKIISYLVRVFPDPRATEQIERYYQILERSINEHFPNSRINLKVMGNKLLVCGQAHDVFEAAQILRIVSPRTRTRTGTLQTTIIDQGLARSRLQSLPPIQVPEEIMPGVLEDPEAADPTGTLPGTLGRYGLEIINMLRVPGEQQVMLKVIVAEIDRTAARSIGVNFDIKNNGGITVFSNKTGAIATATTGGGASAAANTLANLSALIDGGQVSLAINALANNNLARTLAEPNLITLNGRTANFRAGGEFPVPVVTGFTAAGLQGVSFVPFGVQLSFTPIITDKDRIRLFVNGDISTKDVGASANVNGTNVPSLNSRTFDTTVELRRGQTLAVAGLIQNNYSAGSTHVPFFGSLPLIGRLFSANNTSSGEQELVVLVTPELVHPANPGQEQALPGSDTFEPGDAGFYFLGRLEGRRPYDYRGAVRTDFKRQFGFLNNSNPPYVGSPYQYGPMAPPMQRTVPGSPNGRAMPCYPQQGNEPGYYEGPPPMSPASPVPQPGPPVMEQRHN